MTRLECNFTDSVTKFGVSGSPSSTSSSQGSCPSGQVQTINTLSLPGNTASLYNRQISLTVSVEHDSFDPPTYTRSLTSNNVQFPVPVTSVTIQEISTDNQKVGQREGTSLTLTCVTSASFPASTVRWSSLPSGTTPSTRQETTSGVLVKTTNSVTFSLRRSDQDRTLRCEAANINGQTSPRSNRAVLEIWFGPDSNQVRVTKTPDVVAVEGRDLTLTCATLTPVSPGVTFTWEYSDGSTISGGSTGSVTESAGNTWSQTLTFQPIRSKTSIRCRVRNTRTSEAETGTLTLDVKWPPSGHPSIQDFSSPMYSGDRKTIRCRVTGGNPLADITWSCHNTNNTGINSTNSDSKISSLSFMVTKQQNSQQCQCSATWMYGGYDQTDTETFNVYYPADTPTLTDPGTLCEGKSTSVTCSSADPGNPPASYYWTKNMATVHTGNTYTFTPGRDDHQAEIRCSAGNNHTDRAGHTRPQSGIRQLNVYYSPVITVVPGQTLTRKEGQSLSLICSADSNPGNAVLSWTFSGQSWTEASLQKTNLSRSDDGVYTCRGRVNTGSVCPGGTLQGHRDVTVTVNSYPPKPTELLAWSTGPTTIKLSWRIGTFVGFKQQFMIDYKEDGEEWKHYHVLYNETGNKYVQGYIQGLKPEKLYFLRVKTVTEIGSSNYTDVVRVLTKRQNKSEESETTAQELSTGTTGTTLIAVAISLIILAIIVPSVLILLFYRRIRSKNEDKDTRYSSFQSRDGNTYEEIMKPVYQNTGFNTGDTEREET